MPAKSSSKKSTAPKKVKATKAKKAPVKTPTPAPVETPTPDPTPVETTDVVVSEFMDYSSDLLTMKLKLKDTMLMCKEALQLVSEFEKRMNKDVKVARKLYNKKLEKSKSANNSNSGFTKLGHISTEMCEFLGVPQDHMMARVDVTREITDYCKKNGLQKPEDKRILLPDSKLQKLLQLDSDVTLTFFNLQKYLKNHFQSEPGVSGF